MSHGSVTDFAAMLMATQSMPTQVPQAGPRAPMLQLLDTVGEKVCAVFTALSVCQRILVSLWFNSLRAQVVELAPLSDRDAARLLARRAPRRLTPDEVLCAPHTSAAALWSSCGVCACRWVHPRRR